LQTLGIILQQKKRPFSEISDGNKLLPCKYGIKCYRKNEAHFLKYAHPNLEKKPKKEIPNIENSKEKFSQIIIKNSEKNSNNYDYSSDDDQIITNNQPQPKKKIF